jgi:hypothetical protein
MSIRGNETTTCLPRSGVWPERLTAFIEFSSISKITRTWGPEVYLQVEPLTPRQKTIGDRVRLLTRGKLPYKIRWQSEIVQANPPHGFMIRATGDFDGRGIWSLKHSKFVVAFQAALSLEPSLGHGPRSGRPWPQNDVGPLNRLAFGIVNAHNEDSR